MSDADTATKTNTSASWVAAMAASLEGDNCEPAARLLRALLAERDAAQAEVARLRARIASARARLNQGIETFHLSPTSAPGVALVVAGKTRFANEEDVESLINDTRAALAKEPGHG